MKFADFLEKSRNNNELSFRQLEARSDELDHAYIYRLAKGDKVSPSENTVQKLATALQLSEREAGIFRLLAQQEIDDPLYEIMVVRDDLSWETLECAATMSNRGKRPSTEDEWLAYIKKIETLFSDTSVPTFNRTKSAG